MDIATIPKRAAALGCAAALAASCCMAIAPQQAYAARATDITLHSWRSMPFYDDAHSAAKPVWKSSSKVVPLGGIGQCSSIWYAEKAWDVRKAGNGLLLSDIGTDLDGDSYDIKIVAKSVKGLHTDRGTVSVDIRSDNQSKAPSVGSGLSINLSSMSHAEASFAISYLKHGTSKAANVKAVSCVYDIDAWNWGDQNSYGLMFGGNEGVSFAGDKADCYVTGSTTMSANVDTGDFFNISKGGSGSSFVGYSGKNPDGAVVALHRSSSYSMAFSGIGAGIDVYFDTQEAPGNPHKEAKVMMNELS